MEHTHAEKTDVPKHSHSPKPGEEKITHSRNAEDLFTELSIATKINYTLPPQIIN